GAVENEAERLKALAALAKVSLLKHDPFEDGTPAVTVHRLVQAVARAPSEASRGGRWIAWLLTLVKSAATRSAREAVGRLIARLAAIYPYEDDPQSWPLYAQLTLHLLALRDASPHDTPNIEGWVKLLNHAGSYFVWRAAYSQAEPLLRDALEL